MTDSARTEDDGDAEAVQTWPRWSRWLLGDMRKMSVGLCLFASAVLFYNGVMATWRFFTEASDGWVHYLQLLGPSLIAGGVFYLWAGLRLHRVRAEADEPRSPAVH